MDSILDIDSLLYHFVIHIDKSLYEAFFLLVLYLGGDPNPQNRFKL